MSMLNDYTFNEYIEKVVVFFSNKLSMSAVDIYVICILELAFTQSGPIMLFI